MSVRIKNADGTWSQVSSAKPVDNLSSTSTLEALTANQGKVLNESKQDKLTVGTNIVIDGNNTISAIDTTYAAGNGISVANTVISAKIQDNLTSTATTEMLSANQGKVLNESKLSLSGGTMTGAIIDNTADTTTAHIIKRANNTGLLCMTGGTDDNSGGLLRLYGKDSSYSAGNFELYARTEAGNYKGLIGKTDGSLTWCGNNILNMQVLGSSAITGLTNGTVNSVSYVLKLGPGLYYMFLMADNVNLGIGETKIATNFKINNETVNNWNALSGNHQSSGSTFYCANGIATGGGLWISIDTNAGSGQLRLGGIIRI